MASLIARVLGWAGYARTQPRPGPWIKAPASRSFAGGDNSQLTAGWSSTDWHINQSLYRSLRTLRARSRDLARNNDYARQFLRMVKTNVVGATGFSLQVHALKRDGSIDELDSSRCETAFWSWGKREACDYCGNLSWTEIQQLYIETLARDGEVLVRRIRGAGPFGYQLQLLDPGLLDERYNTDLPGGRRIRMGIELDANDRRVAYHLVQDDLTDPQRLIVYGRRYVRVPADEIWHDFVVEQIGQLRGVPWMASTLIRQKRMASFEDSALAAAEEGAKKLAWIQSPDGDMKPLADAQATDGEASQPPPESGTLYMDSGGVHYAHLPPGYEVHNADSKYPEAFFGDFVKAHLRGIASGLGVSYFSLASDLEGVNFSSSRAGLLEEREVWKGLQNWMIERLCARVYSEWLPFAIVSGQLALPMEKLAKFDAAIWQGRRWSWVDPVKDVEAHVRAVENGFTSRGRVIRDMGYDPEEVWAELDREKERLKGLLPEKQPAQPAPPAEPNPEDEAAKADRAALTKALLMMAAREPASTQVTIAEGAIRTEVRAGDTHVSVPEREVTSPESWR